MNIEERIQESEKKFEQKQGEREQYLKLAEECMTEMTKLQGEWRVLQELLQKTDVVDAKPEKGKK